MLTLINNVSRRYYKHSFFVSYKKKDPLFKHTQHRTDTMTMIMRHQSTSTTLLLLLHVFLTHLCLLQVIQIQGFLHAPASGYNSYNCHRQKAFTLTPSLRARVIDLVRVNNSSSEQNQNHDDDKDTSKILNTNELLFPNDSNSGNDIEIIEFELLEYEHKPLGCTAEESLDESLIEEWNLTSNPPVFVSSLVEGGNAKKAGLIVGDVVLAVSGIFEDSIEDVHGLGLDRVKTLVSGRPHELPLTIRVARGTSCRDRHEAVLMRLCEEDESTNEKILGNTITSFISHGYFDEDVGNDIVECSIESDEADCMIDAMCAIWGEECDLNKSSYSKDNGEIMPDKNSEVEAEEAPQKKKLSGYFSRSSPSGTYTRDPTTGKIENVDT